MTELLKTPLHGKHVELGAKMVDFGGWDMPVMYPSGVIAEHLATRSRAGLFDVSHMGRFVVHGSGGLDFLQHALTNNAAALGVGQSQYTIIANQGGGAVDDAYLYRFVEDEYLLVINASNRDKDWDHFQGLLPAFPGVELVDAGCDLAMLALQGPESRRIMLEVLESGALPEPRRNALSVVTVAGQTVLLGRTGYTGEPICFELFVAAEAAPDIWDLLLERGATAIGLGARDTLRLEAALPLYGHEFGLDAEGNEIPVMACPLAKFAVSFSPLKGDFMGRDALRQQFEALKGFAAGDWSRLSDLPHIIKPFAMIGRGVGREGAPVFRDDEPAGHVSSGTTVPYLVGEGEGLAFRFTDEHRLRSIGLALVDSRLEPGDRVEVEVRKKRIEAAIVPYHMRGDAPPYARPIVFDPDAPAITKPAGDGRMARARSLVRDAVDNHVWRQTECVNLIPSEMTVSPAAMLLSITDPAFRYAEHRKSKAFEDAEVFYYQGTDFIRRVEEELEAELALYLGAAETESRLVSGQMANTAVFSSLVDWFNHFDRRREPNRLGPVLNNDIGKGGHLSAQPMGALKDYVAVDPRTERPSVVNFPVRADDLYRIDVEASCRLIEGYRPELIIFGKSMVLYPEPVAEIKGFLNQAGIKAVIMYDMAHVLGLAGPHFQQPFADGADFVTGSTHKTFFGTQRGVVGGRWKEDDPDYLLWATLRRRTFPGSVSNHHLGTLLGLLMAAYEMNHFKDEYQPAVLANAKALAKALDEAGLKVAGDRKAGFTGTHQVVVEVGYGKGPEVARLLEDNNIICNYQAAPDEEGFTAAGALRLGVSEMTRFGFGPDQFKELAGLMADVILRGAKVRTEVKALRSGFQELKYCFDQNDLAGPLERLHRLS